VGRQESNAGGPCRPLPIALPKTVAVIGNGHLPTLTKDLIVTYSTVRGGFRTPRAFLVEHRPLGWLKSQNARRGESPAKGVPAPGMAKPGDLELGQHERDYGAWLKGQRRQRHLALPIGEDLLKEAREAEIVAQLDDEIVARLHRWLISRGLKPA